MDIVSVNRSQRLALTDTGDVCPITNMFDADGDETDNPALALAAVAKLPNGQWATIDLTDFEPTEVH